MKCNTTNAILTFVLGVLAVAGVMLVLRTVMQSREIRRMTPTVTVENAYLAQAQLLFNDVAAYNQKNPSPELAKLLQSLQTRPATAK
jgi:hypothetical protein